MKTAECVTEDCVRSEVTSYRLLHFILAKFSRSKIAILGSTSSNPLPSPPKEVLSTSFHACSIITPA